MSSPTHKHPTDRSFLMWIIFSAISCGLYPLFALTHISSELNEAASKRDGKKTLPGFLVFLLALPTLGIFSMCWWHRTCNRIGEELTARDCGFAFGAKTFWGWNVFGVLLCGFGPLIFIHKLCEAMNRLNEDYNRYGCTYPDQDGKRFPPKGPASENETSETAETESDDDEDGPQTDHGEDETEQTERKDDELDAGAQDDIKTPPVKKSVVLRPETQSLLKSVHAPKPTTGAVVDAKPSEFFKGGGTDASAPLRCPQNHENPPGARFCAICGASLLKVCPECGWTMSSVTAFCIKCGTDSDVFNAYGAVLEKLESAAAAGNWNAVEELYGTLPREFPIRGQRAEKMRARAGKLADSAKKSIAECARLDGQSAQAINAGAFKEAAEFLKKSLKIFPERPEVAKLLDVVKRNIAEIDKADALFLSAMDSAIADGKFDDAFSAACAEVPPEHRARCSADAIDKAKKRSEQIGRAFLKFNKAIGEKQADCAAEAVRELREQSVPDAALSGMMKQIAAIERAENVRTLKGLGIALAIIAAFIGLCRGLSAYKAGLDFESQRRRFAWELASDIEKINGLLSAAGTQERNSIDFAAALRAYEHGTNTLARSNRRSATAQACESLSGSAETFLEIALAEEGAIFDSLAAAIEEHRWKDAENAANVYSRISEWVGSRTIGSSRKTGGFGERRVAEVELMRRKAAAGPSLDRARSCFADGDWTHAISNARAADRKNPGDAEANEIMREALAHYRPVAAFNYSLDGKPVDIKEFKTPDGGEHELQSVLALRPGTKRDAEFAAVVRDGKFFVASFPPISADWDGRREFDIRIRRSFAPGETRSIPLTLHGTEAELRRHTHGMVTHHTVIYGKSSVDTSIPSQMNFRWCPPGYASLGCPDNEAGHEPDEFAEEHNVPQTSTDRKRRVAEIEDGFWLSETEVTQLQWESVMGTSLDEQTAKAIDEDGLAEKGTDPKTMRGDLNDDVAMYFVNAAEAEEFCKRLSRIEHDAGRLPRGFIYTLPTGDQWEHACRAGTDASLPNGIPLTIESDFKAPALNAIAWFGGNSFENFSGTGWCNEKAARTGTPGDFAAPRQVGGKNANAWGLRDMLGNVWEWCADDAVDQSEPPLAWGRYSRLHGSWLWSRHTTSRPERGWAKMQRGGAWNAVARDVRPAAFIWRLSQTRSNDAGFRVALVRVYPSADWSAFPSPAVKIAAARKAAESGLWQRCFDEAAAALDIDSRNEEALALKRRALENFKPVLEITPTINGRRVKSGLTYTLDGKPIAPPLQVKVQPCENTLFGFTPHGDSELVATSKSGLRFTAKVMNSGADWDGIRRMDVELDYNPVAGARRLVQIPGTESDKMAFRWSGGAAVAELGSRGDEQGRFSDENIRFASVPGFWIGETEVTIGQWKAVMGRTLTEQAALMLADETKYPRSDGMQKTMREWWKAAPDAKPESYCGETRDDFPIHYVNWHEACEFCRRLTEAERRAGRLPEGFEYSLPTEAQWEYACRAGTGIGVLPNGAAIEIRGENDFPALDSIAWYGGNSSQEYPWTGWKTESWKEKQYPGGIAGPHPVGGKKPNAWGVYDMLGNVWEWCSDVYGEENSDANITRRICRGGSWESRAGFVRPACSTAENAGIRNKHLGFRVAIVPTGRQSDIKWNDFALITDANTFSGIETAEPNP